MSLFGALSATARALDAQQYGLEVTGQNIANVNTPGYSRRAVDLVSVAPADENGALGGVDVQGSRSVRDLLLERRLRQEWPSAQKQQAIAESLGMVEVALGTTGESLDARLTAFFDAFSDLSEDPVSSSGRQAVVIQGQTLAAAFNDMAARLDDAQRDANARLKAAVDEVNSLSDRIATLNSAIGTAGPATGQAATLRDEQSEVIRRLTELVNISAVDREDGGIDVSLANGHPLAIGSTSYELSATPQAPDGFYDIETSDGTDVTAAITGGRLGGLLSVRDTLIPDYEDRLDTLAYTLADEVNTIHDAAFDGDGNDAPVFFTALAAVAGAAAALVVNPTVAADSSRVGAADVAAAGNNNAARAISALRNSRVLDGGQATFQDAWGQLVYRAGSDAQSAQAEAESRAKIVRQVEALRDAVSGVSLDEEAMQMLKYQRAYEANARFFNTINEAISMLLSLGR